MRAVTPRVVIRTFDWPLLLLAWKALARNAVRSLSLFAQSSSPRPPTAALPCMASDSALTDADDTRFTSAAGVSSSAYLDFKKVTALPTNALYEGVLSGKTERVALIPEYYIHDLIHRFYGFLSRVALPT